MKKTAALILFIVCTFSLCSFPTVSAVQLKGDQAQTLYKYIVCAPDQPTLTAGKNGLNVEFTDVIRECGLAGACVNEDKATDYWYTRRVIFWNNEYVAGVAGYTVTLTNTTDKLMAIEWSQSSITIGDTTGVPFLDGMKYRNAGNPSATPDTVVPPHQSVKVNVYIPNCMFLNGWQQGFVGLKADGSLKGALYIKVVDEDGHSSYTTADSPNIILPQSAFALTKVTVASNK